MLHFCCHFYGKWRWPPPPSIVMTMKPHKENSFSAYSLSKFQLIFRRFVFSLQFFSSSTLKLVAIYAQISNTSFEYNWENIKETCILPYPNKKKKKTMHIIFCEGVIVNEHFRAIRFTFFSSFSSVVFIIIFFSLFLGMNKKHITVFNAHKKTKTQKQNNEK